MTYIGDGTKKGNVELPQEARAEARFVYVEFMIKRRVDIAELILSGFNLTTKDGS